MRRFSCGFVPVLLLVCGCDRLTSQPVASSDPIPIITRDEDPDPPPPTPVENEGPPPVPLVERAREILPPVQPGMIGDFEIDGVVVRCLESYVTEAGCTLSLLLLSLDEDRETGIPSNTSLFLESDQYRVTYAVTRDVTLDDDVAFDTVPILLPANVPVAVDLFWHNITRPPRLFALSFRHSTLPLEIAGNATYQAGPDWNDWPTMEPDEIDAGLRHLAQCKPERPGTACWYRRPGNDSIAIEFSSLPMQTGTFTGKFFILEDGGVQYSKDFTGELTRDDEHGQVDVTLQSVGRSGVRGRPTERISSWNLLLRGTAVTVNLRLFGHELLGSTTDGVNFDINAVQFEPVQFDPNALETR